MVVLDVCPPDATRISEQVLMSLLPTSMNKTLVDMVPVLGQKNHTNGINMALDYMRLFGHTHSLSMYLIAMVNMLQQFDLAISNARLDGEVSGAPV